MRDEPELLVPVSELQRPAPEPEQKLTGWRMVLWRLWVAIGVITIGPLCFAKWWAGSRAQADALAGTAFVLLGVWLLIAWIFKPLLSNSRQR